MSENSEGDGSSEKDPVGTKRHRVTRAIHDHFLTDKSWEEIADDLGVEPRTARMYVNEPPAEEVQEIIQSQATSTRIAAWEELKRQLREAGQRSRTAEKPVKIWPDDGSVHVSDVVNDRGEVVDKIPIPEGFEIGPDEEARFYGRHEAREILEMMIDLVGAAEPETLRLEGDVGVEHSGEVKNSLSIGFEPTPLEEEDLASERDEPTGDSDPEDE